MTRPVPWHPPAWTDDLVQKIRFVHELRGCGVDAHVVHPGRHLGALVIDLRVSPLELPERRVRIVFARGAEAPKVYVDGPSSSPHRYSDGAICMWYPQDPPERRWRNGDGARALLGHIVAHLVREHWWRLTAHWPGDEAPHDSRGTTADPERGVA